MLVFFFLSLFPFIIKSMRARVYKPESPPTSIFLRFLASRMTTVSLPAVGT
ncbi:unnamed protein product [Ixodes pacificus]